MSYDLTYNEIALLKEDITKFLEHLSCYSQQNNFQITQNDKDFFAFLSKRISFLKTINQIDKPSYSIKVLISDMYNLIITIISNQKRYIYLNERSIIENYMRLVLNKSLENDHITVNLFDEIKNTYPDVFSPNTFSLLKSEYCMSCSYVHGGRDLDGSLISYFKECIHDNESLTDRQKYYDRIKKIIQSYETVLLYTQGSLIDVAFHRRKSVLGYLLGGKYVELLFQLKQNNNF